MDFRKMNADQMGEARVRYAIYETEGKKDPNLITILEMKDVWGEGVVLKGSVKIGFLDDGLELEKIVNDYNHYKPIWVPLHERFEELDLLEARVIEMDLREARANGEWEKVKYLEKTQDHFLDYLTSKYFDGEYEPLLRPTYFTLDCLTHEEYLEVASKYQDKQGVCAPCANRTIRYGDLYREFGFCGFTEEDFWCNEARIDNEDATVDQVESARDFIADVGRVPEYIAKGMKREDVLELYDNFRSSGHLDVAGYFGLIGFWQTNYELYDAIYELYHLDRQAYSKMAIFYQANPFAIYEFMMTGGFGKLSRELLDETFKNGNRG